MTSLLLANTKGGAGKSTCTTLLAVSLAKKGIPVTVIDLSFSSNASMYLLGGARRYGELIANSSYVDKTLSLFDAPQSGGFVNRLFSSSPSGRNLRTGGITSPYSDLIKVYVGDESLLGIKDKDPAQLKEALSMHMRNTPGLTLIDSDHMIDTGYGRAAVSAVDHILIPVFPNTMDFKRLMEGSTSLVKVMQESDRVARGIVFNKLQVLSYSNTSHVQVGAEQRELGFSVDKNTIGTMNEFLQSVGVSDLLVTAYPNLSAKHIQELIAGNYEPSEVIVEISESIYRSL